jgi:hypothetical protein
MSNVQELNMKNEATGIYKRQEKQRNPQILTQ